MPWIVIPVAVLVLAGAISYLFGPTIKTFFGPDFEPAPKDHASVENATMTRKGRWRRRSVGLTPWN